MELPDEGNEGGELVLRRQECGAEVESPLLLTETAARHRTLQRGGGQGSVVFTVCIILLIGAALI